MSLDYDDARVLLDRYLTSDSSIDTVVSFLRDISESLVEPETGELLAQVISNLRNTIVRTDDTGDTKVKYMGGPVHSLADAVITVACSLDRIARTLENIAERQNHGQ